VPAVRCTRPGVSWATGASSTFAPAAAFTRAPAAPHRSSIYRQGISVWEPTGRPGPPAASTPDAAGVTDLSRNPGRTPDCAGGSESTPTGRQPWLPDEPRTAGPRPTASKARGERLVPADGRSLRAALGAPVIRPRAAGTREGHRRSTGGAWQDTASGAVGEAAPETRSGQRPPESTERLPRDDLRLAAGRQPAAGRGDQRQSDQQDQHFGRGTSPNMADRLACAQTSPVATASAMPRTQPSRPRAVAVAAVIVRRVVVLAPAAVSVQLPVGLELVHAAPQPGDRLLRD
jgi:hypothetical protein